MRRPTGVAALAAGSVLFLTGCADAGGEPDGNATSEIAESGAANADTQARHGTLAQSSTRASGRASTDARRTLVDPAANALGWVAADWLGLSLPIEDWAERQADGELGVDEFNREAAVARSRAQYESERASAEGVGKLRLTLSGELSEYDRSYGEYYVDTFAPGNRIRFAPFNNLPQNPFPNGVQVSFDNAADFASWPMDASAAQQIARGFEWGRRVTLQTNLRLLDVNSTDRGADIVTRIERAVVVGENGRRLGIIGEPPPSGRATASDPSANEEDSER